MGIGRYCGIDVLQNNKKELESKLRELHAIIVGNKTILKNVENLNIEFKEIEEEYDLSGMEMDDLFEEYMQIAEEKAMELEDLMPMYSIMEARSYKWDMSENKIKTVMAVTHTDLGTLKLSDVVKRLLSETD